MKRVKKTSALTTILISSALVLGSMPAAMAAPISPASAFPATQQPLGGFTGSDWRSIANTAEKAGDRTSANAAREAARTAGSGPSVRGGIAQHANVFTGVAKKLLVAALRHGGPKLPQRMRPCANKMANTLEDVTEFQEGALVVASQQVEIPYDVAQTAAVWCVVFLGVKER